MTCASSCRRRFLPIVGLSLALAGCAAASAPATSSPDRVVLPDDLQTCLHATKSPAPLGHVIGTAALRDGYDAERRARLADEADTIITACAGHLEAIRLRRACECLRALWSLCDRYFALQAPWATIGHDRDRAACATRTAVNLLRLAAIAASPVLPDTSRRIADAVSDDVCRGWPTNAGQRLIEPGGQKVCAPGGLFPRLPPDWASRVAARHGL